MQNPVLVTPTSVLPLKRLYSKQALKDGLPMVLGYFPYGLAYGFLAGKLGMTLLQTLAMSVIVYAGSAQLIAVGMLAAGQATWAIIIACWAVNLRYLLMATAILPEIKYWSKSSQRFFLYYLSDEVFALFSSRKLQLKSDENDECYGLTLAMLGFMAWITSSTFGFIMGPLLPDLKTFGLDYALTSVFAGLVAVLAHSRQMLTVSLLAGLSALFLHLLGLSAFAVLASAAFVSMFFSAWENKWPKVRSVESEIQ